MKIKTFSLALALALSSLVYAEPTKFMFSAGGDRNVVKYESEAPIENIIGITGKVDGEITLDVEKLKGAISGKIDVDVASFKSGIDLRDEHFRDNYLHTAKFPKSTFTFKEIISTDKEKLAKGETAKIKIKGTLDLHGVQKEITIEAKISYLDKIKELEGYGYVGNILVLKSDFVVALKDYGIERPAMLALKLGENIKVSVSVTGTDLKK
ncbi:YceI family protein [bacterium]|nr:YceI family protein [bacterium]